ncbi:hypothetical protein HYT05_03125 [Candidatus Kaiserbacteria bacterium]|nr:hypothetical protein [Candidatus Kaiserbacteria bacterium]
MAPDLRTRADEQALRFKAYIMNGRQEVAKIIPFTALMMRYFIHEGALAFARAAHFTGVQAHRLADFVSHKHHFERQAPRSEFLKRVSQISERSTPVINTATSTVSVETAAHPAPHITPEITPHTSVASTPIGVAPVSDTKPTKATTPRHRKKKHSRVVAPSPHDDIDKHLYEGV